MMNTKPRNLMPLVFFLIVFNYVQFIVLTSVAMFYYPGGTIPNHETVGYSFWGNTFCDLGRSVSLSGEPNTIAHVLFVTYCGIYGVCLLFFFAVLPRLFPKPKSARLLAIIGSIFGIIAQLSIIGVAQPLDLHESIHTISSIVFWSAFCPASLLYSIAIFRNESFPNTYAYLFLANAIVIAAGAVIAIITMLNMETEWRNTALVAFERVQLYSEVVFISIVAYGAWRVEKRLRELGPKSMLAKG